MLLNNLINRIKQINPNIEFAGEFDDRNRKTGYWEHYYSNGNIRLKCGYLNGIRDGLFEVFFYDGTLQTKGSFKKGRKHGEWVFYHSNSNLFKKTMYDNGFEI